MPAATDCAQGVNSANRVRSCSPNRMNCRRIARLDSSIPKRWTLLPGAPECAPLEPPRAGVAVRGRTPPAGAAGPREGECSGGSIKAVPAFPLAAYRGCAALFYSFDMAVFSLGSIRRINSFQYPVVGEFGRLKRAAAAKIGRPPNLTEHSHGHLRLGARPRCDIDSSLGVEDQQQAIFEFVHTLEQIARGGVHVVRHGLEHPGVHFHYIADFIHQEAHGATFFTADHRI